VDESGSARFFTMHDAIALGGAEYFLMEAADGGDEVLVLRQMGDGLESVEGEELERVVRALAEDEPEPPSEGQP